MKLSKRMFLPYSAALLAFFAYPLTGSASMPKILSLSDLKAGTKAIGFSVFKGVEPEPFSVLLGEAHEEMGMTYIYARISGGPGSPNLETPLEQMGAIAGMSGSPVFTDCLDAKVVEECASHGTLVGAISLGFTSFPLGGNNAGITPAEKMLGSLSGGYNAVNDLFASAGGPPAGTRYPILVTAPPNTSRDLLPKNITVLAMGGEETTGSERGTQARLKAGSMISVYIARGDMPLAASGTVTWVDGDRMWAFGHPFFLKGAVQYPFAQVSVDATFQTPVEPYKSPGKILGNWGVITLDGVAEVSGVMGKTMQGIPFKLSMQVGKQSFSFNEEIVPDTPIANQLLQQLPALWMKQTIGDLSGISLGYQLRVVLQNEPGILLQNVIGAAFKVSPVEKLMGVITSVIGRLDASGFPYALESVRLNTGIIPEASFWRKERVFLSKIDALPGETVILSIILRKFPEGDAFRQIDVPVTVPADFLSRNPFTSTPDTAALPMFFGNVPISILVQGGSQFTDISLNHKVPHSLDELIAQINYVGMSRPDTIYIQEILPPKTKKASLSQGEPYAAPSPRDAKKEKPSLQEKRERSGQSAQNAVTPEAAQGQIPVSGWRAIDPSSIPTEAGADGRPDVFLYILPPLDGFPDLSEKLTLLVKAPPSPLPMESGPQKEKKKHFIFF